MRLNLAGSESGLLKEPLCGDPLPGGVRAWLAEKQNKDRLWKSVRLIRW
jgi:hypothetical protein